MLKPCKKCGRPIIWFPSYGKERGFWHVECRPRKGAVNPNWKGGKITKSCERCGASFSVFPSRKGSRFCSWKCKTAGHSADVSGPKNGLWKGGTSDRFKDYGTAWRRLSKEIMARDGNRCRLCGTTEKLVVHHKDEDKKNRDPGNLLTVCRGCHRREHRKK